jgi:hypothetical protein
MGLLVDRPKDFREDAGKIAMPIRGQCPARAYQTRSGSIRGLSLSGTAFKKDIVAKIHGWTHGRLF